MTPIEIGGIQIKNRVFLPGHTTNFGINNLPTQRNANYLATRAQGGVGLIITEAIRVHPTSAGRSSTLGSSDDRCIPSFKMLTEAVHAGGAKIFAQIMHAGRQANGDSTHTAAWSASTIPWTRGGQIPHHMSQSDINKMVKAFGESARRMQDSDFDGLEVHLGHGHLLQQFLSPASNKRQDNYGGALENRMRFTVEVLNEIFNRVPNMCVGIRISADEFMPNGLDPEAMLEIVAKLNQSFKLDFIHVSHSAYHGSHTIATQIADMSFPHAPFKDNAAKFKSAFPNVPILAVCRLDNITAAAQLIDNLEADMVGLARPHIADPEIVNKFNSGRNSEVTSCIACNQECIGRVEKNLPISCAVNPDVGAEAKWVEIRKLRPDPKKVLVVGGGAAGMSAALSASAAGHHVTLVEGANQLGGQIRLASTLKMRSRIGLLTEELEARVRKSNIDLQLGKFISSTEEVLANFDKVILATGAQLPKRDLGEGVPIISAQEAIESYCTSGTSNGEKILIFDEEGSWISASIAEELANRGYKIHLVSPTASLFSQITTYSRSALIPRLKTAGVQFHLAAEVAVESGQVVIKSSLNAQDQSIENVLAVVDCGPRQSNDEIYQSIQVQDSARFLIIGDALSPRTVAEATYEGNVAGAFLDLDLALSALEN
jgi:2,4-dienoyl-CoA reductase-like NADH-dependent reductase (Old Yellow Enzyme family)/thioredoxin reductase